MRRICRLFNFLAGLYELAYKPAKPMSYRLKREGRVVEAAVHTAKPDQGMGLLIRFQRKLASSDLRHGKIVPVVSDEIVRRGGKRNTEVLISLEAAESLYIVLGKAISNAQALQRQEVASREMMEIMMTTTYVSASR